MNPAFGRLAFASILCLLVLTAAIVFGGPFDAGVGATTDLPVLGAQNEESGESGETGKSEVSEGTASQAGIAGPNATVTRVYDGDTVEVRYENGSRATVRLLGIDAPEVHGPLHPGEFEGVSGSRAGRDCLREVGRRATQYLTGLVADETVDLRFDPVAGRRGVYDRVLGYLVLRGENINFRLVEDGFARVYESEFSARGDFYRAERAANSAGAGVWGCP